MAARATGSPRAPTRRALLAGLAGAALAPATAAAHHGPPLRELAAARGLVYGSSVRIDALEDPAYAALQARESAVLVPSYELKWHPVARRPGVYDFAAPDRLMRFAGRHGAAVRGHTLLWHRSMPAWLDARVSAADMERHIETHAATTVGRYAGRIGSWDVVNEAVSPVDGRPDGLRASLFLAKLGERYIDVAFRAARAADPAAELVYNDFGVEHEGWNPLHPKREKVLELLKRMLDRGVPVDALGVQGHLATRSPFDGDRWLRWLERVRALGLRILVTELDVNDAASPAEITLRDAEVAELYRRFLAATLACRAVTTVVTWGISDRYSWVVDGVEPSHRRADSAKPRPLPFDRDLAPKLAHVSLAAALTDARPR
ncbi:MAG: endo-1,4-beta-xylanase [Rhodospirillales bacterium]|nr:MAG: endo-1,4-beta-xylanase [Rhodospirillales bacterium]